MEKRQKWTATLQYLFFAALGRIVVHFLMPDASDGESLAVPLIGAGIIVLLLPHILKHRAVESEEPPSDSNVEP